MLAGVEGVHAGTGHGEACIVWHLKGRVRITGHDGSLTVLILSIVYLDIYIYMSLIHI